MTDEDGCTPLHSAAECGELGVVEVLVQAGADTTAVSTNGKTAEQIAREAGHTAVSDFLIRHVEEQAVASVLLLDNGAGTGTSGEGQKQQKAKAKKKKQKAKQ